MKRTTGQPRSKEAGKASEHQFPERVVLGVGYPWAIGLGTAEHPYDSVHLNPRASGNGGRRVKLRFPKELWRADVPKYRLVLERVR